MRNNIDEIDYEKLINIIIADPSDKALCVTLIACTGARPNEILKMNYESTVLIQSMEHGDVASLRIIASKRSDNREIMLPPDLYVRVKNLRERLKERKCSLAALIGDSAMSVSSNYALIRKYFNRLQVSLFGEQRYTMKSFRHSLAMRALKSGIDITNVQVMMGHRSLTSTEKYLKEYKNSIVLNNVYKLVRNIH